MYNKNSYEAKVSMSVKMKSFPKRIHNIYEFIYNIAAINPLTPSLCASTATTEDTVAANVAGAIVAAAEASTTSDISSPKTALIFPWM
jgi:hypothetical protein